LIDNNRAYYRK